MRAASAGDANARSVFARTYLPPIRAYLGHRWSNSNQSHAIDDAVQDVFVECMKPNGVLDHADPARGDFRALLYGVVRNIARRFEKLAARPSHLQPAQSVYLDELPAQHEALSRVFDGAWARSLLREAVLRHARAARRGDDDSRRRYRILRLRHQKGLPIREISAHLDESDVDAVHNAYRRGRREFREYLREVVAQHTGAASDSLDAECRRVTELLGS
mgnify:CR=1 FL=1